jgi:hypothetical protein
MFYSERLARKFSLTSHVIDFKYVSTSLYSEKRLSPSAADTGILNIARKDHHIQVIGCISFVLNILINFKLFFSEVFKFLHKTVNAN